MESTLNFLIEKYYLCDEEKLTEDAKKIREQIKDNILSWHFFYKHKHVVMKHVLITGGAGFLGSNLAKYIKERNTNIEISIVDDLSAGKLEFVCNDKIKYCDKFICDDFSSKQIIDNLNTKGYDVVYHLAAIPRVGY